MNNIMNLCSSGGIIVLFSGFSGTGLCNLALNSIHYKEIELIGSSGYRRQDYLAAFSLLENDNINVKSLISDIFPIEEFKAAYEKHRSGDGFKILIKP
jgi:Threonine dehydrogenase and related Zn-dependent dehydrogenases